VFVAPFAGVTNIGARGAVATTNAEPIVTNINNIKIIPIILLIYSFFCSPSCTLF